MSSILITRPRATAVPLAAALERLGYKAVIEPLLDIEPLITPRPQGVCDAVMITSGNVLPALAARRDEIAGLFDLPCFCVGARTAEKASAFGFRHVQNAESDGAELAQFAASKLNKKNATILHLAGHDIDSKAQQELERQGHRVAVWPVYRAIPVAAFTPATRGLLEKRQIDAAVVFSPRTAETLAGLLAKDALEACCAQITAICLSPAVAAVLQDLKWRRLAAASLPTEDAVIACLQENCPVTS